MAYGLHRSKRAPPHHDAPPRHAAPPASPASSGAAPTPAERASAADESSSALEYVESLAQLAQANEAAVLAWRAPPPPFAPLAEPAATNPDLYLARILAERGYETQRTAAQRSRYHRPPSAKMVTDYDLELVQAVRCVS